MTMHEAPLKRLSAFIGRSFLEGDKQVWHDLREVLDALRPIGFVYEDAKEAQPRPISEKVKELVSRNDIYIGVLTQHYPILEGTTLLERCRYVFLPPVAKRWTASEWVVEEIGYALGKHRPVILLIEEGVVFPTTDLDADTEWVPFRRKEIAASQPSLTSMISNLIGKRMPAPVSISATTTDSPPPQPTDASRVPGKSFPEQMDALRKAAAAGETDEADRIQKEIVETEGDAEAQKLITIFLFEERARRGDGSALSALKTRLDVDLGDFDSLISLSNVYASFGEYGKALDLFARSASIIDPSLRAAFAIHEAALLRKDGKTEQAIQLLRERLSEQSGDNDRLITWKALAHAADDLKDKDLETAFLEKILELEPTNHDRRFRLAWLYGDTHREKLAAYHYELVVRKAGWEGARNNLAVVYGTLGLKASQVGQYLKAMEKHELSKANIAGLYAEGGFLDIAESYAKNVLQVTVDENANARARYILDEIAGTRTKEKEALEKIDEQSRSEREFMSEYAEGYCSKPVRAFSAVYNMPHGDIALSVDGSKINGIGDEMREWSGGLLAGLMMKVRGSEPYLRRHVSRLDGDITGRAGRFELTTEIFDPATSAKAESTRSIKGLFVIQPDLKAIKFLEREHKQSEIVIALRQLTAASTPSLESVERAGDAVR